MAILLITEFLGIMRKIKRVCSSFLRLLRVNKKSGDAVVLRKSLKLGNDGHVKFPPEDFKKFERVQEDVDMVRLSRFIQVDAGVLREVHSSFSRSEAFLRVTDPTKRGFLDDRENNSIDVEFNRIFHNSITFNPRSAVYKYDVNHRAYILCGYCPNPFYEDKEKNKMCELNLKYYYYGRC